MDSIRAAFANLLSIQKKFISSRVQLSEFAQKDATKSVEARKKGNQLYLDKNNHSTNVHQEILSYYSKSIAFAPMESEELALAYSNRSALWLHLQRFDECLADIEKSMQNCTSDALKSKLEARKEKCLELMESSKKKVVSKQNKTGRKNLPAKQSYEVGFHKITHSSQMPVASEAVTAAYSETLGRHLIATRDIKAGEVVLLEKGYMCLPQIDQMYCVCNHCLKFAWNGIPCDKCAFGYYCSEECKKEAWDEYHEVECILLPFLEDVKYEEYGIMNCLIMAIRMLIKAIKKDGIEAVLNESKVDRKDLEVMMIDGVLHHDKFKTFYNLLGHEESIRMLFQRKEVNEFEIVQLMSKHTNIFDAAKHPHEGMIGQEVLSQLGKILGKLIDIIKVNAFGYHGSLCECSKYGKSECECGSSKGMIFASCASLINHDCAPNVCRMSLPKGKIALFTFTPVKKGEQLCDSYGPTAGLPKKERIDTLQKQHFFTCKCVPCKEDWFSDGLLAFDMSQKEEDIIKMKIMNQFEKSFPRGLDSSLFTAEMNDWILDEEQLKMALKMTELTYKYYKSAFACFMRSLHFRMYIDMAFNQLFGENAALPGNCLTI